MTAGRPMLVAIVAGLLAACVSPVGGWDVATLLEAEEQIAAIPDQRLGDMTPHPALVGGRLSLVACRYAGDQPVRVSLRGSGWPSERGALAIGAVDEAVSGVALRISDDRESEPGIAPTIEITSIEDPDAEAPSGMADTLAECDVSRTSNSGAAVRGRLLRSKIRIRLSLRDRSGRVRLATDAEWVGALMHEMGHALGFAGHAAVGDSLVLLEESRLRALGRRALAGEPVPAPNLEALYEVSPGRVLGEVAVSPSGREWIDAVESLVSDRNRRLGPAIGPIASAGDRGARLLWRWPGGIGVELRFPFWRREIQMGHAITVLPSEATRRMLAAGS